jgi:hypothetical protein
MAPRPPPGTTSALLLSNRVAPLRANTYDQDEQLTFVYLGAGRRLELSTREPAATPPLVGGEMLSLDDQQLIMRPGGAQSYQAKITHAPPFGGPTLVTWVSAFGYTRAELLGILRTLGPPTIESYRAQAQLFTDRQPHGATFEALLGALEPPPGDGAARHTVVRVFTRHALNPDSQTDPYHQPRYAGLPERSVREIWSRGTQVSGTLETTVSTFDTAGALVARTYQSRAQSWIYNAPTSQLDQFPTETLFDLDMWSELWHPTILNMLACGSPELRSNADGTRTVSLVDTNWKTESCQHPIYSELFRAQTSGRSVWGDDQAPYLADVPDRAVTTWADLDPSGRLLRLEVRAGTAREGMLLQSWELEKDEQLAADQAPAAAFDPAPPPATVRWRNVDFGTAQPPPLQTATLTEALALARTPLFGLRDAAGAGAVASGTLTGTLTSTATLSASLATIESGTSSPEGPPHWFVDENMPFLGALHNGYALRLTYTVPEPLGAESLYLYEGPAKEFGAYLRAVARWSSSVPVALDVGGRQVAGWQVTAGEGGAWTLFEIDSTLIAVEYPFERAAAAITELQRISN